MDQPSPEKPESSSLPTGGSGSRLVVLVSVHKVVGTGLTQEVESLLRHAPMKRWTLREVLSSIRCGAMAGEVNSILYKLERDKRLIVKTREHNGRRIVNAYQWRLPSHGR